MKVKGTWLQDSGSQALCAVLANAGHQALFVGGCIRNDLIGAPVSDIDIATDALPETVIDLAKTEGFKVVATGLEHGTVTVIAGGVAHEVTTFRQDVETDGRHAVVAFSRSILQDAARRDFTMNALYAQADGTVIDPLGGVSDLQARHVRFVGNPEKRILEDYLRILRFFRFHAWYGDDARGIDPEGLAACAALCAGIDTVSKERIGAEMRKLLSAPDPSTSVAAMDRAGVLGRILPGASARNLPHLVHLGSKGWQARLTVLGGQDASANLRLSKAETTRHAQIQCGIASLQGPAELGYRYGQEVAADIVLCRAAILEAAPQQNWMTEVARGAASQFPVAASDLMPDLKGAALGNRLRELESRWIASDFKLRRADLLG